MASLSSYDVGKKEFVFQNVQEDIESLHTAENVLYAPMHAYNKRQANLHKAKYEPIIVKLIGNHEYRLKKLLEYEPRWQSDTINMDCFNTRHPINEIVVPFMDWITIDGVSFAHYWSSGVMGRAIGNAKLILAKKGVSCVQGHTHTWDWSSMTKPDGTRMNAIVAGCFLDPDHKGFGGPQVDALYYSGLTHLHAVKDGDFDLTTISTKRLLDNYA
jgi:hypothetical protein